jgi:hypothetical protein
MVTNKALLYGRNHLNWIVSEGSIFPFSVERKAREYFLS